MKKRFMPLVLSTLIFISSCGGKVNTVDSKTQNDSTNTIIPKDTNSTLSNNNCDYESDIIPSIITKELNLDKINPKDSVKKTKVKNTHDPDVLDTEYYFVNNFNRYNFYITESDTFLLQMIVTQKTTCLSNSIQIGSKKEEALKYFELQPTVCDKIILHDLEGYTELQLTFDKDELQKIILTNRID